MTGSEYSDLYYKTALRYFPPRIQSSLEGFAVGIGIINEIRVKSDGEITLRNDSRIIPTGILFTREDMKLLIRSLCGNSLYSHSESLKEGFITTAEGIRCGIAGRAVCEGGSVCAVCDITTVNIRIPSRFPGAAKELHSFMEGYNFRAGVLVYSPPSGGKTTLLRELCDSLSNMKNPIKVAVIDTRCEITPGLGKGCYDALLGYPRAKGIEIAIRALSPQLVLCDEINTAEDALAVEEAVGAGVPIVASAHGCHEDIMSRPVIKKLIKTGAFKALYGIEKRGAAISGKVTFTRDISV